MGNFIYQNILTSEINSFRNEFLNTTRSVFFDENTRSLFHSAEFGQSRERAVKKFFKLLTPQRLAINSGFLITPKNEVSTQCDIVIYDSNSTPLIQDDEDQKFYPIETVVGIGEVKSVITKTEFKKALNKLARNKKLRSSIVDLPPTIIRRELPGVIDLESCPYDHIFSVLICEKLDFNIDSIDNNEIYEPDVEKIYWHNMILSINDGLIFYKEGKDICYPISSKPDNSIVSILKYNHLFPNRHFEIFAHYMFSGLSSNTIYFPDMWHYLS